jgi:hypothetical protein
MTITPNLIMAALKALLTSLISFRTAFLLLCLLNLKSLPLSWHLRLFYYFARHMRRRPSITHTLSTSPSLTHPIFLPVSLFTRAPLLETDYNLHKSNSTYFSDLDQSRTALVTSLLSAGFREGNAKLEAEGKQGKSNVILGAAHASFYREVGMYERYEVRSRVLGWDQKWLVILSVFVRPGKKRRNETAEKTETVLASALSKYVVKKGRYTVPPEDCLAAAGWFEGVDRPEIKTETEQSEVQKGKTKDDGKLKGILKLPPTTLNDTPPMPSPSESTVMINRPHEQELEAVDIAKLEARAEEMSARVDEKWGEGLGQAVEEKAVRVVEDASTMENMARQPRRGSVGQQWTWEMIEKERLRGMEVARGWTALDGMLKLESERAVS